MKSLCLTVFCLLLAFSAAEDWVVLVSGNSGWYNYCITSTICRGYEIAARNGIPEDHIIYVGDEGVFYHKSNPFPGEIFTASSEEGKSENYGECRTHIDYNSGITPGLFMNILLGDADAIKASHGIENPKVLKSTEEDNVFVYYMDHGGPGICVVGEDYLTSTVLMDTIQTMHSKHMYKNLVFYFEACYSGSMFTKLPKGLNVYAFTGADDDHSAYMSYCPPDDVVDGQELGTCLSAYYDDAWEDLAEFNTTHATHNAVYKHTHEYVAKYSDQNVSQYGDIDSVGELLLSDFIGERKSFVNLRKPSDKVPKIPLPDVPVHLAKWRAIRANKNENGNALKELEEAIMTDVKKEIYVSRLIARSTGEQSIEKARSYEGKAKRECVNELAFQLVTRCGYELPFREEHNRALHYICNSSNMSSTAKLFSEVC